MMMTLVRAALSLALFGSVAAQAQSLALTGCKVYASPDAVPLLDAVVVTASGRVTAVGGRSDVQVPGDARVIDCGGKTVVAGFWNSHVHFTEAAWRNAATAPAAALEGPMREMLTRWGFTTVWDIGSNPDDSLALRRRIRSGEIAGPDILLAGNIFPKGGHPVYLPAEWRLPEAGTPDEAAAFVRRYLAIGLDGVKLFAGAYMGPDKPVVNMDAAVAKAATDLAHAAGKPVFAHPQNRAGVDAVVAGGVDVMAHTVPAEPGYTPEQIARFKPQGIALTPTLTLWTTGIGGPAVNARRVDAGVSQLKAFAEAGGTVLFGTDVGYIRVYDTSLEYEFMGRALSASQVLASVTTNPARYFKAATKGKVETGFDADLVVLDGDPMTDVRNLAKVAYTIRAGRIIYQRP
jgi:imidazolonepropionase-like amidohydrolase